MQFTWTPLREATPMYRKTPYRTGIGMNYRRDTFIGFLIKQTHCLACCLKCGLKCFSDVIKYKVLVH